MVGRSCSPPGMGTATSPPGMGPGGGIPVWARRHEGKQSKVCFSITTYHTPPTCPGVVMLRSHWWKCAVCMHLSSTLLKCMLQAFGMQLNERQECLHQNGMMYLLCWGWFIDPGSTWRSLISIISHAVDVEETYTKKKKRLGNLKENSGLNCKIGS